MAQWPWVCAQNLTQQVPEVVVMGTHLGMAEFVEQEIILELVWEKLDAKIDADGIPSGAGTPPGLLISDAESFIAETVVLSQVIQTLLELRFQALVGHGWVVTIKQLGFMDALLLLSLLLRDPLGLVHQKVVDGGHGHPEWQAYPQ